MARAWRRVQAGGYSWRIHFVRDLHAPDGDKVDGLTLIEDRTIQLEAALRVDPEALRETLIHELLHAAVWHAEVDLGEDDEPAVTRMAAALAQLVAPFLRRLP